MTEQQQPGRIESKSDQLVAEKIIRMSRKPPPTVIDLEGQSGQGNPITTYSDVPATVQEFVEDATPSPGETESSPLCDEPHPLKDGQEKKETGQPKKETGQRNLPKGFIGYAQDSWAFCKTNKGPIAAAVFAVVACLLMYWSHTSVGQNAEILARLPTETTEKKFDDFQKKLKLAEMKSAGKDRQLDEKDRQLDERDTAIRKLQEQAKENLEIACLDRGSNGYSVVYCNFTNCEEHRVDGEGTVFKASITPTDWFPSECLEGKAVIDVLCYSVKGIPMQPKEREHPGCPGKKQFQCGSVGMRDDYYGHDFFRDVYAIYKTCKTLATN